MIDSDIKKNIEFVKKIIKDELLELNLSKNKFKKLIKETNINEFKSKIDKIVDKRIYKKLKKTKINILSEENNKSWKYLKKDTLTWIVDPLDGTINYNREILKCGISIALFDGMIPLFGIIGVYPDMKIYYGGVHVKSRCNTNLIKVSNISKLHKSILCTGFPARYKFNKKNFELTYNDLKKFGKIRMIGSASISMLLVAMGKVEAYKERNIMIWDIAAGMAILNGAGGKYKLSKGNYKLSFNITAHNNKISI